MWAQVGAHAVVIPGNFMGASLPETISMSGANMRRSGKSYYSHSSCDPGLDAVHAVFYDQRALGSRPHAPCRVEKNVRRRLVSLYHADAEHMASKPFRQSDRFQAVFDAVRSGCRTDANGGGIEPSEKTFNAMDGPDSGQGI